MEFIYVAVPTRGLIHSSFAVGELKPLCMPNSPLRYTKVLPGRGMIKCPNCPDIETSLRRERGE